jgi:ubiquinone/menaquinone biosynthesis C-methylase UbiE
MEEKEKYWSRFADNFEENNNYVVGQEDMNIAIAEVDRQRNLQNVLELACGNGTYSRILSKNADKVTATDFSDEMVEASRHRLKDLSNVKVEKANAFLLNYDENSFDTVFMANLLHVVPNPEDIISEVKRTIKKRGKIIILDFTADGMKFRHKLGMIYRYLKTYGKPPSHGRNLNLAELREMLVEKGFELEKSSLIGKRSKAVFAVAINR